MINWQSIPRMNTVPGATDLSRIPLARAGEFELSEREVTKTRRLVYSINAQGRFRYRTQREGRFLMVWRIK